MLWGRMGYNPALNIERIKGLLALHYPKADVDGLYDAWTQASQIPSKVTGFHWNSWDFQWAVEGCLDLRSGFHTVERFINNPAMEGLGIMTIPEFVDAQKKGKIIHDITPLQISSSLDLLAIKVFVFTDEQIEGEISESYDELIYDLKAWAFMGKYYASKIRGAYYLHAYKNGMGDENKQLSIKALNHAFEMWQEYAKAADRNYKPQFMAKTRTIDWNAISKDVAKDIEIVKNAHCSK